MYLTSEVSAQQPLGRARLKRGETTKAAGRTRIFLEFRIRGLEEDLYTVKRRNDRLCLRKADVYATRQRDPRKGRDKAVSDIRHIQQHRQRCRSESLGPRF